MVVSADAAPVSSVLAPLVGVIGSALLLAIGALIKLYGDVREEKAKTDARLTNLEEATKSLPEFTGAIKQLSETLAEFRTTVRDLGLEQKELVREVAFIAGAERARQAGAAGR